VHEALPAADDGIPAAAENLPCNCCPKHEEPGSVLLLLLLQLLFLLLW
jgi:hypothetical protein